MVDHVLLLLRHAKAESYVAGARDDQRPLTARGRVQAAGAGDSLRGTTIDHVLCSPSVRTRQTLEAIEVAGTVDVSGEIYDAGSDTILSELAILPEEAHTVLVVGHAPGIPGLARDLADPDDSDVDALDQVAAGFPPATLARLEFTGSWAELSSGSARLVLTVVQR